MLGGVGVVAGVRSESAAVGFLTLGTAFSVVVLRRIPDTSKSLARSKLCRARGSMRQQTAAILMRPRAHPQEVGQPGRHRRVLADDRFRGLREEGRNWRALHGLCMLQRSEVAGAVGAVRCGLARTLLSRSCVAELDRACILTDSGTWVVCSGGSGGSVGGAPRRVCNKFLWSSPYEDAVQST